MLGDDPAAAHRETARAPAEAWRQPGRLDRTDRLPFGELPDEAAVGMHLVETVLHGWDLARATGQDPGFDPGVVEAADRFARSSMPERRPAASPFANAVEAPPGASPIDRLAAYAGRRA